ncbi:MAG TPA: prepilin-type N-terminal cleavage/methylation domain-containing protein [Bacilli bacterium]|nr:prepilin-type N-terminal cleavage/methylation domain-containing protein [Bacilli bacterium]
MELIRKLISQRIKNQRGVTLIELLAVIVILGIIAAIGIPAIVDSRDQAEQATYETNATLMTQAIRERALFNQTYNVDATETDTTDAEYNLTEIDLELGLEDDVLGTEVEDTLELLDSNGDAVGTYEFNENNGTVTFDSEGTVDTEADTTT